MKLSERVIKKKLKEQHNRCFYCGNILDKYEIDHILPKSKYKNGKTSNLCLCCLDCNRKKSNKYMYEWYNFVKKYYPEKLIRGLFFFDFINLNKWKENL